MYYKNEMLSIIRKLKGPLLVRNIFVIRVIKQYEIQSILI